MAFSTLRGRPKSVPRDHDPGTPELRLKHALGVTAEPIDLCLSRGLITPAHHRSALHLRWLHTLRHGAPIVTTRYGDRHAEGGATQDDPEWRSEREREYHAAIELLNTHHRCEPVMRLSVYNELPAFLNPRLQQRAWEDAPLGRALWQAHHSLREGLEILAVHWKNTRNPANAREF